MKETVLLTICMLLTLSVTAQKKNNDKKQKAEIVEVEGRYRIVQTENLTEAYCKRKAMEQARLNAIERRFGSYFSSSSVMLISARNNESSESYCQFNTIDVKGIWLGDDDSKVTKTNTDDGKTIWDAWVKGKARERSTTHIDYDVRPLVNGTDQDQFRIWFKSPVNGYVMIFATDGEIVNKFVPAPNGGEKMVVEAGMEYLFPEKTYYTAELDEGKQMEYYKLIVLFSRNELLPPNLSPSKRKEYEDETETATIMPLAEMKYEKFVRFYEQLLSRDSDIDPRIIELVVKRRN